MKKSIAVLFVALMFAAMSLETASFAAEGDVDVLWVEKNGNIISINAINSLSDDTVVTLTVTRDDEKDSVWHYDQKKVSAGETAEFSFVIPAERDGVSGAGKYIIAVQNLNRDRDEEILYYADDIATDSFAEEVRKAAQAVTVSDKAYEKLLPLMTEENAGAIIALGIDYSIFAEESDSVKQDTMNFFYSSGVDKLEDDEMRSAFSAAFSLAVYNNGEKEKGIGMYAVGYDGKPMDDSKYKATVSKMDDVYSSVDEFKTELCIAYGIITIADAKMGTVGEALLVFGNETGECTNIINKIEKLSLVKQKTAYEYIVKEADSDTDTIDELETILKDAYNKATKDSSGGGGASGSSSNRVQSGGGSVSVPQGSGISEVKAEENIGDVIFDDVSAEYWAAEAISGLKEAAIINGNETGMYEPEREITREEFTKMIVMSCGFEAENSEVEFSDVMSDAWYIPYIGTAVEKNIVKGIGDNKFGVGEKITRQDMSVMIRRAIISAEINPDKVRSYIRFDDENEIAEYALNEITELYEMGIVNGKGNNRFEPLGNATRAEAAKIIYEAFKEVI